MPEFPHRQITHALRGVRAAETQAIAIYRAESFWIRVPARRKLLREILAEELAHDDAVAAWADLGRVNRLLSMIGGRLLGTLFALLPWKWLCRLQSLAENAAAGVYATALARVRALGPENVDPELIRSLERAERGEREHAYRMANEVHPNRIFPR